MAERAILARRRGGGRYGCYRARWGGTDRALAAVCAGTLPATLPVRWEADGNAGGFSVVVAGLDYLSTEVVYRRERGRTTAFLTLWFGLPLAGVTASPAAGALVEVASLADARLLRCRWRQLKGVLADALVAGTLPATAVPFVVQGALVPLVQRERYGVWEEIGVGE